SDPHAAVTMTLARGVIYNEPVTQLQGSLEYSGKTVNIPDLRVEAPAGQIKLNGSLVHAPGDFKEGQLKLHIESGGIELARVQHVQERKPGLGGVLEMVTDMAATLHDRTGHEQVLLSRLDASVAAKNIALNKQPFGGATFQAKTSGNTLSVQLDSDFAKSKIHGSGQAQLSGNYPIKANLTFSDIKYSNLKPFLAAAASTTRSNFDGQLAGQLSMNGPVTKPEDLNASLQLSQFQLTAAPREPQATAANFIVLQNQQPIVAELNHSVVTVKSAHLTGRDTDITIGGTAALQGPTPLKLDINAKTNLSLLQDLNR